MPSSGPQQLRGSYPTPRVSVGQVLHCEARRCPVVVVGFSSGPIPWPVGRRSGGRARGAAGMVVYGGLADALRREPRHAVARAWGVSPYKVTQWRRALGLGPGPAERARRSAAARRKATAFLPKGRAWTTAEDAVVRARPPQEAARLIRRSISAVYNRRAVLGLPRRKRGPASA